MKHIEVVAAVIIRNKKVFCAQRTDSGETAKKWEFPGGKIEAGETREQALEREIQEEFSTQVAVGTWLATSDHQYRSFSISLHAYLCEVRDGTLLPTEHLATRWIDREELSTVDWAAADLPIVEKLREIL